MIRLDRRVELLNGRWGVMGDGRIELFRVSLLSPSLDVGLLTREMISYREEDPSRSTGEVRRRALDQFVGHRRKPNLDRSRQQIPPILHRPTSDPEITNRRIPARPIPHRSEFSHELFLSHSTAIGCAAADQESESYPSDRSRAAAEEGIVGIGWRSCFAIRYDG